MQNFTVSINVQQIVLTSIGLAAGILIGWWQPWSPGQDRVISVAGEAVVKAEPDEFVFTPSYQAVAATSTDALQEVSKAGDAVVEHLMSLNVEESAIKTDVSSFPHYFRPDGTTTDEYTAHYMLTVTVSDKDIAQEILDYLLTTENRGSSTPQSIFSEDKKKELKLKARRQAIENARSQGEQIANEIGGRVGKVLSVEEMTSFDVVRPLFMAEGRAVEDSLMKEEQTRLLVGEQDLNFSVKVVFSLR